MTGGLDPGTTSALTVGEAFVATARAYPREPAIASAGGVLTYAALSSRVEALCVRLAPAAGVGARVLVACTHPEDTIVAILAALRLGLVYVPFDWTLGPTRLAYVLADAAPHAIIADPDDDRLALAARSVGARVLAPGGELGPGTNAYDFADRTIVDSAPASILYTSGSTGTPKGVLQPHRSILHHAHHLARRFAIGPGDKHAIVAPFSFDASTSDVFSSLLTGACLVPAQPSTLGYTAAIARLSESRTTILHTTPTLFRRFCQDPDGPGALAALRLIVLGGEPVLPKDLERFACTCPPDCLLVNGYGTTETSGFVALANVDPTRAVTSRTIPIGFPTPEISLHIRDPSGTPTREGELWVESRHMALGYWNDPELTARRFPTLPGDGADELGLYRTGDLARLEPDGALVLLARNDDQVKVRGQRVELAEVEIALEAVPGVAQAAAVKVADCDHLAGFVVPVANAMLRTRDLEIALAQRVPPSLLPIDVFVLASLPVTVTGKVDRQALSRGLNEQAFQEDREPRIEVLQPVGDIERLIHGEWIAVGGEDKGVNVRFFDMGGDSLRMARFHAALTQRIDISVPLFRIYSCPTIRDLAHWLVQRLS